MLKLAHVNTAQSGCSRDCTLDCIGNGRDGETGIARGEELRDSC